VLTIAQTPETLTVYTPIWIGGLVVLVAVALFGYVAWSAKRREKLSVRVAGAGVGALMLAGLAWSLIGTSTTMQKAGVISDGPLGEVIRAPWSLVRSFETDERPSARFGGKGRFLVLQVEGGDEVEIPLSGLADADAVKVIDFVKARIRK
jgi:hypothetical protein